MRAWTVKLLRDELSLRGGDPAFMFATAAVPGSIDTRRCVGKQRRMRGVRADRANLEAALYRIAADLDAHGGPAVLVTDGMAKSRRRRARDKRGGLRGDSA